MGLRVAGTSFLIVINLVSIAILGTSHLNKNVEKVSHKKSTMKPTSTSSVAVKESVGSAAYIANSVEIDP